MTSLHVGIGNHVENTNEINSHHFDLFSRPKIDDSMHDGYDHEIHLSTLLSDDGPYEFYIAPSKEFIQLNRTRLEISGKILRAATETAPAHNEEFSVCNLFPQAIFRQVDVNIGGINTSNQDNMYAYKSYLETFFSYCKVAKTSHLKELCCYIEDTPGKEDKTDLLQPVVGQADERNAGFLMRNDIVRSGNEFNFSIPIHADIFQCNRLIPPNTPIRITLHKNPDTFPIIAAALVPQLKIKITQLNMFIRRIVPSERVMNYLVPKLLKQEVVLPFSRAVIKKETIPQQVF